MIVYQTFPLHPDQSSTGISFWAVLVLQQQPSPLEALEDTALLTAVIFLILSSLYPSSLPLYSSASGWLLVVLGSFGSLSGGSACKALWTQASAS